MKPKFLCAAAMAALLAVPGLAQIQSGSGIGARGPSTGTSGDTAGAAGTTAPRSPMPETSVGSSGATAPAAPARSSGLCDTLTGDERTRCQREQAAAGTQGSAATGSTGAPGTVSPGTSRGK